MHWRADTRHYGYDDDGITAGPLHNVKQLFITYTPRYHRSSSNANTITSKAGFVTLSHSTRLPWGAPVQRLRAIGFHRSMSCILGKVQWKLRRHDKRQELLPPPASGKLLEAR